MPLTPCEKLRSVTVSLLDRSRPSYSLRSEVLELKSIFENAGGAIPDKTEDIGAGETRTESGLAISPTMASMCFDDFARTVQFIRGLHNAIADLREKIRARPIQVLYAGCGPWAALAVPLMTVFDADVAAFTLLDIHSESIASTSATIDALGLSDRVVAMKTADAANYSIEPTMRPDIVIVEMMRAGLEAEPQVAVSRNLMRQAPGAVLIPEAIRIDLSLVNAGREFLLGDSADSGGEVSRDRIAVGTVLVVEKETLGRSDLGGSVFVLPVFDEDKYQPMLLTTVRVYGDHLLQDYDSGITLPKAIPVKTKIKPGDEIRFVYELGAHPRVTATVVRDSAGVSHS